MFLKRAILHGFKSFADRTEFEFGDGVTCVVGPNGCGKSNVLDAVRWVLGEQSAKSLRGDRMLDVVFAGSRSRKPANFAEVSLVFDNTHGVLRSDDTEVTVGRILYRSGESDYRLNGKSCRLKDLRELFLDTGVGVDAYSIIEQGRVDSLLQASPVQRREIFEEAAGISRYKVRRLEAQRKLERTQANLLRLQDIVEELEKRLRSVRLAAGKARNFLEYDQRLRELRSSYSLAEYHELEQRHQAVAAEVAALSEALQDERATLSKQDTSAAELGQKLQALDEQIQEVDTQLRDVSATLSALEERLAQGRRRIEELQQTQQRRTQQAAELTQRQHELDERVVVEESAIATQTEAEQRADARIAEIETGRQTASQRVQQTRTALESAREAAFDAARRASLLQNERTNLEQQQTRLDGQVRNLKQRQDELADQRGSIAERCAGIAERLAQLDRSNVELSEKSRQHEAELSQLHDESAELDRTIGQAKESRSALSSRLSLLEDMERRYEGVEQGTRDVLAWRDDPEVADNIIGLVADILRIDDPRVAVMQPVLSQFEDHVLVRDTQQFLSALAARGVVTGSVRVLGLDRLRRRAIATGYETVPGYVARASDWVSCDAEFRDLAEHLLGRVIVVESVARALQLASEALAGYTFVTADGWTVRGDGTMQRGPASAATGLISRKAEIRQLQAERDEVETQLVQLTRRRMEVDQAVSDLQLQRQAALEELARLQQEHAETRGARDRAEDQRERLEREARVVASELENLEKSQAELDAQRRQIADEGASAGQAQQEQESRIEALAQALAEAESVSAELSQAHTEARVEKERASEKRASSAQTLVDLRKRRESLAREQESARREAAEADAQIATAQDEITATTAEQETLAGQRATHEAAVYELRTRRQALRQAIEECGAESRAIQRRIEAGESTLHEKQVLARELEVRREGLVTRTRDELELDLTEQYASYEPEDQDWDAVQAEIEELRGKIQRLGNVNLDAIQELDELTPRYDHLIAQRDDLTSSVARLETLIEELDTESRVRFAATFEQVRENFQEMFRKLFGGGKADIILEDPEMPLECGIEIIARPPGKEPQSISLLSGGEKTMTAVALVLAVFKSRPSPFAILDEVDAALDESNTERFNKVLQDFLSHSQFVVITHSKRTMAGADVLYGITMEEPGVSKRVSVRFDDRVETPEVA